MGAAGCQRSSKTITLLCREAISGSTLRRVRAPGALADDQNEVCHLFKPPMRLCFCLCLYGSKPLQYQHHCRQQAREATCNLGEPDKVLWLAGN